MKSPPASLREAWRGHIAIEDYERHMAAIGQAQANAALLEELFRDHPPRLGAPLLFAGAGTGQYFDYLPPHLLARYRPTFADINPAFLARLSERLAHSEFATAIDDIEASRLKGPFDLAIAILVLEHTDWRKAVASLAALASRVFAVIQRNPPQLPARELPGTLAILREIAPALVDPAALSEAFAAHGFQLRRTTSREAADGKIMLGLDYTSNR